VRKITIRNLQKKIPIHPQRIKQAVLNVFAGKGKKLSLDVTVSFVNDNLIKKLNKRFLKKDEPTDVLAFELSPKNRQEVIADLVISADTAKRNAGIYGTSTRHELELYAIHGALHILGYDDSTPALAKTMRKKECQFIRQRR